MIYKLLTTAEWRAAEAAGVYGGSDFDRGDGFIHFSAADQVVETAARVFAGQNVLTMLIVDSARACAGRSPGAARCSRTSTGRCRCARWSRWCCCPTTSRSTRRWPRRYRERRGRLTQDRVNGTVTVDCLPSAAVASTRTLVGALPIAFHNSSRTQPPVIVASVPVDARNPAAWV